MNKPALIGYMSLEEFRRDFQIFIDNPNDKIFMSAVNLRVRQSSKEMQIKITDEILTGLMETNPAEFVRRVAKTIPMGSWMIVKSNQDPFFEA